MFSIKAFYVTFKRGGKFNLQLTHDYARIAANKSSALP